MGNYLLRKGFRKQNRINRHEISQHSRFVLTWFTIAGLYIYSRDLRIFIYLILSSSQLPPAVINTEMNLFRGDFEKTKRKKTIESNTVVVEDTSCLNNKVFHVIFGSFIRLKQNIIK
ncbi:hypothetical protein V8G54_001900 [Vigna mungo]|uniref:Uncharacterized protein n=1 Tax=Vigna mungo TaxID=3915 RepID=A0AAQ3SBY2_VIGMU